MKPPLPCAARNVDRKSLPAMQAGCIASAGKFDGNKQTYAF